MVNVYKYLQALSIDIAIGGGVGVLFVSKYLSQTPNIFVITELILTIWIIYTFDHLIDSRSGKIVTFRHKLHRRYHTTIWGIWSLVLVVSISLVFKIPFETFIAGSFLMLLVVLYFISLIIFGARKVYHKEGFAAIIYAAGIFTGPISIYQGQLTPDIWILFVELFLLAFVNLLIFSLYEVAVDERCDFQSLVRSIGFERSKTIAFILLLILIVLSTSSLIVNAGSNQIIMAQLVIFAMSMILAIILLNRRTLIINERYRVAGDSVFFIPLIYVMILNL